MTIHAESVNDIVVMDNDAFVTCSSDAVRDCIQCLSRIGALIVRAQTLAIWRNAQVESVARNFLAHAQLTKGTI